MFTIHKPPYPYQLPQGWEWTTVGESLLLISGQDFPPEKYNNEVKGIPYIIGASNIEKEQLIINRWTDNPSVFSYLNDILVVCKGAGVGKLAINNIGDIHIARQIQAIRDVYKIMDIHFLKAVISSNIANVVSQANGLIPGLKRELLLNLSIPVPPIEEQHRIVTEIESLNSWISIIEESRQNLKVGIQEAKSKILDLAIHGKLVPQDSSDEPASELLKRINPKAEIICDNPLYGKLPKGWTLCRISAVVDIVNGKSQKDVESSIGKYPIYGSGGIIIGMATEYICQAGSTIIGRKGTINHPIFVEENFWNVDTAFGMKADYQMLDDKYFYYFCLSFDFSKLDKSSALPSLTKTVIGNQMLPIPPLQEQHRIVAKIEEIFSQLNIIELSL